MMRRLIFVCIPIWLPDSGRQIQFLILVETFYIIWYGQARPHKFREDRNLELFNEAILMILYYHVIIFSDFILEPTTKFQMGYSFLAFISLIIMMNLFLSFQKSYTQLRIKRRRQREKPIYDKAYKK
jgi:hypothetical protein